jgi:3-oxoacyl-[acyl-carrier protein] reductase
VGPTRSWGEYEVSRTRRRETCLRVGAGIPLLLVLAHSDTGPYAVAAGLLAVDAQRDRALTNAARSEFGGLEIVVANTGIDETGGPVLDIREAGYDRIYNVNAKGAFFTLQKAARMVNSGGTIVYVRSSATLRPVAGFGR